MKILGLNLAAMPPAAAALLIGLALTPVATTPAAAEMTAEQACTGDAYRLCNEFIPDRNKVGACLRRNARSLSADCRTFVIGGGRHVVHGRTYAHTRVYHHYRYHRQY